MRTKEILDKKQCTREGYIIVFQPTVKNRDTDNYDGKAINSR